MNPLATRPRKRWPHRTLTPEQIAPPTTVTAPRALLEEVLDALEGEIQDVGEAARILRSLLV